MKAKYWYWKAKDILSPCSPYTRQIFSSLVFLSLSGMKMGGKVLSESTISLSIKHGYCTKICMQLYLIDSLWPDTRHVIVDERHLNKHSLLHSTTACFVDFFFSSQFICSQNVEELLVCMEMQARRFSKKPNWWFFSPSYLQ